MHALVLHSTSPSLSVSLPSTLACFRACLYLCNDGPPQLRAPFASMRRGPGLAALDRSLHSSTAYNTLGNDLTASQSPSSASSSISSAPRCANSRASTAMRSARTPSSATRSRDVLQHWCGTRSRRPRAAPVGSRGCGATCSASVTGSTNSASRSSKSASARAPPTAASLQWTTSSAESPSSAPERSQRKDERGSRVHRRYIVRSIKMLAPLGCGYEVFSLGNGEQKMVRSVPRELDTDTMVVLSILLSAERGSASCLISPRMRWSRDPGHADGRGTVLAQCSKTCRSQKACSGSTNSASHPATTRSPPSPTHDHTHISRSPSFGPYCICTLIRYHQIGLSSCRCVFLSRPLGDEVRPAPQLSRLELRQACVRGIDVRMNDFCMPVSRARG